MNRRNNHHETTNFAAWARRAATVAAVLGGGLGIACAAFAAPLPNTPASTAPQPYSWPTFHAGGVTDSTASGVVPYGQEQGTPSGLVPLLVPVPGGTTATEIPSRLLGNYNPAFPPAGFVVAGDPTSGTAFPNHFNQGSTGTNAPPYLQIASPLAFTYPDPASDAVQGGVPDVQSSPTAINDTEYPDIDTMFYYGVTNASTVGSGAGSNTNPSAPDVNGYGEKPVAGGAPLPPFDPVHKIRQVVYYGRVESVPVIQISTFPDVRTAGGVPTTLPVGSQVQVGALYCMDGFTGQVIWRYQVPSFNINSTGITNTFNANITGTVHSKTLAGVQPFQVGPTAYTTKGGTTVSEGSTDPALNAGSGSYGTFTSYSATGNMPMIGAAMDLNKYGFTIYATSAVVNPDGTATYAGTFRIYAPGYGYTADDGQILEHGTFTATATFTSATAANVTGVFVADKGTLQPPLWPVPVDFSPGSPARFTGTFSTTGGVQTIAGNLATIPGATIIRNASVFSSPSVAKVNVYNPADGTTAPRLCVFFGDNNGFVYCLDALGNRDGTSNSNIAVNTGTAASPIFANPPQIAYDPQTAAVLGLSAHVGTTNAFWTYRPDPNQPKQTNSFTADVSAQVQSVNRAGPQTIQVGPSAATEGSANPLLNTGPVGTFTSYVGTGSLPTITGGDLNKYGFTLYTTNVQTVGGNPLPSGTPAGVSATGPATVVYTGTFRIYAPGYGYNADDGNILEHGIFTITATFTDPYNAALVGTFEADPGTLKPPGWPVPVDFSPANPAPLPVTNATFPATPPNFVGSFHSDPNPAVPQTITGRLASQPGVKTADQFDSKSDLPVPQAFGLASPTVYVDPTTQAGIVYVGSSNGVLYALDATGAPIDAYGDGTAAGGQQSYLKTGDTFNVSIDTRYKPGVFPYRRGVSPPPIPGFPDPVLPSAQPLWWFSAAGQYANLGGGIGIGSAPALLRSDTAANGGRPTVYVCTTSTSGVSAGRLYAVDALNGPIGDGGAGLPSPGSASYNVNPRTLWAFPDAYGNDGFGISHSVPVAPATKGGVIPPLGSITGSPVVFRNNDDGTTRVYFAANTGQEVRSVVTGTSTTTSTFPSSDLTGRVWAVNTDGSLGWAFPSANDPNNGNFATTAEPSDPIGGFQHATPAMGFVQYPKLILDGTSKPGAVVPYTHHDQHLGALGTPGTFTFDGTAVAGGPSIPMLYVGTYTADGSDNSLYYLDVDGANDTDRFIYQLLGPSGGGFQSSPALIVNASTSGGNGGALFITEDNTLYQFQATPTSNPDSTNSQAFPIVRQDQQIPGCGPVSSPSVAAASVADLFGTGGAGTGGAVDQVRDWVYVGDNNLGICRGFTPNSNFNGMPIDYPLPTPPIPPQVQTFQVNSQFPLRAFIFDGTGTHVATTSDMTLANPLEATLPVFEWGQDDYIRVGNVVPPLDPAKPNDAERFVKDLNPNDQYMGTDIYFGDGQPIQFATTDVAVPTTANPQPYPRNLQDTFLVNSLTPYNDATPAGIDPTQNGFYERADVGTPAETTVKETNLLNGSGHGWVAAYTYHVAYADGLNRRNTPGARRRIISASQSVQPYTIDNAGNYVPVPGSTREILTIAVNGTQSYIDVNGDQNTFSVDQPTFGILNPLAVRGGGVPLGGGSAAQSLGGVQGSTAVDGIGPFRGISDRTLPKNPTGNASNLTAYDMQAITNGNMVYTYQVPPSGFGVVAASGYDPTKLGSASPNTDPSKYPQQYLRVITSSNGDIGHGTLGDNTDPAGGTAPFGSKGGANPNGLSLTAGFGPDSLDIADRSMLGQQSVPLNAAIQATTLGWNDNTGLGGPGARINPLAWEILDPPITGYNTSLDYPDIPAGNLTHTLKTGLSAGSTITYPSKAQLDSASGTAGDSRQVNSASVRVQIVVPKYQPANLQMWNNTAQNGIQPTSTGNSVNPYYPMGYVSKERVTASVNNYVSPTDDSVAYREVYVYTGVPVDMTTSISTQVADVGVVPHGFGLNTQPYTNSISAIPQGPFAPVNPSYQPYFRPLTIYNNGNTNLVNPHFDQKLQYGPATNATALPLLSDALDSNIYDPLSYIPGYDYPPTGTSPVGLGQRTGPRPTSVLGTGSYPELPYLLRSSLDTDLANAYGINPGVSASLYPVVTFHKPRVSDGNNFAFPGTVMTVPDVPHDNDVLPYQMAVNAASPPSLDPKTNLPNNATPPYVSVAVPLGTPVGTYLQRVRMFEGLDSNYDPLVGPKYNGVIAGTGPFVPLDTFELANNSAGAPQALQPYTDPGTQVQVTVQEARVTDGLTPGALPMFDALPANGKGAADFLPTAFRDPMTGALSMYWTTARNYTVGGPNPPYSIFGANLSFNEASGNTYFQPDPGGQKWWSDITSTLPAVLTWSVASDQVYYSLTGTLTTDGKAYGFDTTVVGSGNAAQSDISCYQIVPGTGKPTGNSVPVAASTQPKSGVHGLKFSGISFADPNSTGGANAITNNLWAFWAGGTRGRTALYYSPATASPTAALRFGVDTVGTETPGQFATLPVPASLTALANPSAVLTYAPDPTVTTGAAIPVIEVTYSGVSPTGSANLYLSRYRPYHPKANGTVQANVTLLAALPFPKLVEQLQPQPGGNWWQARDVGWLRNNNLNVILGTGASATALLTGKTPLYDRASGLLAYTGVTINSVPNQTVLVDVGGGRVRFGQPLPAGTIVSVTINPTARRITTDSVADFAPSVFLDEAYQTSNDSLSPAVSSNIQADRYWFVWQKAGIPGVAPIPPTLWYKTQRLTVALTDASGDPTPIPLIPTGSPNAGYPSVTVKLTNPPNTVLYTPGGGAANVVDVDATRGRLYFPVTNGGIALEGQPVTVTVNGNPVTAGTIHWVDEPRYNDPSNQIAANDTTPGAIEASASDGYLIRLHPNTNDGGVAAFLDPLAYNNPSSGSLVAPHSVWLFWNSTRNGTSDIFYEAINPRFSPVTPASGAP